jgi:hypothetical protein
MINEKNLKLTISLSNLSDSKKLIFCGIGWRRHVKRIVQKTTFLLLLEMAVSFYIFRGSTRRILCPAFPSLLVFPLSVWHVEALPLLARWEEGIVANSND